MSRLRRALRGSGRRVPDSGVAVPSGAGVLHESGCLLRDIVTVIPFDDAQGQIDSGGQAAGRGDPRAFDEADAAPDFYRGVAGLQVVQGAVMSGRGPAVQK